MISPEFVSFDGFVLHHCIHLFMVNTWSALDGPRDWHDSQISPTPTNSEPLGVKTNEGSVCSAW